jgi:catechol 2,3-dioxygenase-like lactoylglutathione lyase family enzyme
MLATVAGTRDVKGYARGLTVERGESAVDAGRRINRRGFLKRSALTVAAVGAAPLLGAKSAWADDIGKGELGLVGLDHVGLTVPNLAEAVRWFEDVMGATSPLSFGPIRDDQGTLMQDLLGVDPRAVIDRIALLRIGHSANIELFQYEAPDQRHTHPRNSDWSGHHVAFYVTDIDAAVAYMESKGVEKFLGPFPLTAGPAAGQSINYFKTPFGTYIELISYPDGMAYEMPSVKPLWSPKQNGLDPEVTTVPGLLGIDHVGITVPTTPGVAAAAAWFEGVLRATNPLTFGPFSDPTGDFMEQLVDVDPRAVVDQIRMVRVGNGPGVELFQYEAPDQDVTFRRNSDWGGHHVAFYVRHIDTAVEYLQAHGAEKRFGPFPVTAGPAAGQTINYFRTPFGTDVELISYPHGMAYEASAAIPLWDPRDNHP